MFVHGRLYYYVIFRMFWGEVHDKIYWIDHKYFIHSRLWKSKTEMCVYII